MFILRKIAKKRKSVASATRCFFSYFGMNVVIFYVNIFYYIHACVKFYVLNMCVIVLIFKMIIWLDFIISRSLKKGFRENLGSILDFFGIPN